MKSKEGSKMKKKYNFQKDKMEGDFTSENKPNTDGDKAERFISTDAKQSDSHLHEYLDIQMPKRQMAESMCKIWSQPTFFDRTSSF